MSETNMSESGNDQSTDGNRQVDKQVLWKPLNTFQRRVVGVLIEKAKTTPDNYPLTVNSIVTACNQKSNRSPQMEIAADDALLTLDELREMGVVSEVHGSGRAERFRHKAYEWFGVDKVELAVLAELLLRGEQTVGELRGRAARMEPIADLAALRPILESLIKKRLVIPITPEGRGQVITHGVFPPGELDQIKRQVVNTQPKEEPSISASYSSHNLKPIDANPDRISQLETQVELLNSRIKKIEEELGL